jgi:decaprenylphospho-beta-D-ribofuranose 2-oxidase
MIFSERQAELNNWSRSAFSPCWIYRASNLIEITEALAVAWDQRLSVIPHGAGHSYTDAALNTRGVVIDVTPMRRVLSWDAAHGIMRVEPGVTLRDMVQVAWKDGWWPYAAPSTSQATIGGCTAMNVNGRSTWKWGPFGAHVLELEVLLASGELCTLKPEQDPQLFYAFVGSLGLLGILTMITVQLQPISSSTLDIRKRPAASLAEIFSLFAEAEPSSDYMEAWLDGFATGPRLARGLVSCATLSDNDNSASFPALTTGRFDRLETSLVRMAARLGRPVLLPGVQIANRALYSWGRWRHDAMEQRALFPYTFWPPAAFAGYDALLPQGVETFQAFVPGQHAKEIFEQVLLYSQRQGCLPIWCIIKKHQSDPFLLSYQLDGFSLELNYSRTRQSAQKLKQVLQHMIAMVIESGGRFYLAKDHFLTQAQYRQSVGVQAFDTFLNLKQRYDPEMMLQSDLFRRVFQPALQ